MGKKAGAVKWVDNESDVDGVIILTDDNFYLFPCPHCFGLVKVAVKDLNCRIFRHGMFKKNGKGINPHLPKKKCVDLVKKACIYGCAKPFQFFGGGKDAPDDLECVVKECDYI